eukprot:CAMPEP_0185370998 /NCGR_PEP_ID=MMETSP1364-20130426/22291_1 /TAXON_ID=38817 /ORGANISM="Gephyrocapsa oceanica, Strain RCC1303" /LENGTH=208 /DNA_ID=CAMNT_0027971841 /DNA_START=14 /DNA_END=639 /DNA_ORIENTATION=+
MMGGFAQPLLLLSFVASFVPCAAWTAPVKPLRASRASAPSMMVQWSAAPADILWAEAAWVNTGLTTGDLGTECIWIPKQFVPDQSREWYFCSSAAAYDAAVTCLALPMITAGRKVFICSTPIESGLGTPSELSARRGGKYERGSGLVGGGTEQVSTVRHAHAHATSMVVGASCTQTSLGDRDAKLRAARAPALSRFPESRFIPSTKMS